MALLERGRLGRSRLRGCIGVKVSIFTLSYRLSASLSVVPRRGGVDAAVLSGVLAVRSVYSGSR